MNQYEIDYQQGYDRANDKWLDRVKQEREKQANKSVQSLYNEKYIYAVKILDKLITESGKSK